MVFGNAWSSIPRYTDPLIGIFQEKLDDVLCSKSSRFAWISFVSSLFPPSLLCGVVMSIVLYAFCNGCFSKWLGRAWWPPWSRRKSRSNRDRIERLRDFYRTQTFLRCSVALRRAYWELEDKSLSPVPPPTYCSLRRICV